jgi:hypothetical protein
VPKISRETAQVDDPGFLVDRFGELDDYSVDFLTFHEDLDTNLLSRYQERDHRLCMHQDKSSPVVRTRRRGEAGPPRRPQVGPRTPPRRTASPGCRF